MQPPGICPGPTATAASARVSHGSVVCIMPMEPLSRVIGVLCRQARSSISLALGLASPLSPGSSAKATTPHGLLSSRGTSVGCQGACSRPVLHTSSPSPAVPCWLLRFCLTRAVGWPVSCPCGDRPPSSSRDTTCDPLIRNQGGCSPTRAAGSQPPGYELACMGRCPVVRGDSSSMSWHATPMSMLWRKIFSPDIRHHIFNRELTRTA